MSPPSSSFWVDEAGIWQKHSFRQTGGLSRSTNLMLSVAYGAALSLYLRRGKSFVGFLHTSALATCQLRRSVAHFQTQLRLQINRPLYLPPTASADVLALFPVLDLALYQIKISQRQICSRCTGVQAERQLTNI